MSYSSGENEDAQRLQIFAACRYVSRLIRRIRNEGRCNALLQNDSSRNFGALSNASN